MFLLDVIVADGFLHVRRRDRSEKQEDEEEGCHLVVLPHEGRA
jgi:hypothetical protein